MSWSEVTWNNSKMCVFPQKSEWRCDTYHFCNYVVNNNNNNNTTITRASASCPKEWTITTKKHTWITIRMKPNGDRQTDRPPHAWLRRIGDGRPKRGPPTQRYEHGYDILCGDYVVILAYIEYGYCMTLSHYIAIDLSFCSHLHYRA